MPKNFSGSGDMGLNNLAGGLLKTVKVICFRYFAFNIFWQLHFQERSLYRYKQPSVAL